MDELFSGPEVFALADALREDDPTLSLEQALDAATALLPSLVDTIREYNIHRAIARAQLHITAQAWDTDAATGVRLMVTP